MPLTRQGLPLLAIHNASVFNPPDHLPPSLRVFRDLALKDLDELQIKWIKNKRDIEIGMESLCSKKNLVIRPADKGGSIVIFNKDDYMQDMYRILSDSATYTPLALNPGDKYKSILEKIVSRGFDLNILNREPF